MVTSTNSSDARFELGQIVSTLIVRVRAASCPVNTDTGINSVESTNTQTKEVERDGVPERGGTKEKQETS